VQACAVHTVAAVRAILTNMTFYGLDIFVLQCFYSFIYLLIIKENVLSVFFVMKMT